MFRKTKQQLRLRIDLWTANLAFSHQSVFIKIFLFYEPLILIVTFPFLFLKWWTFSSNHHNIFPLFPLHSFENG